MIERSTALRLADALNCATDDDCGYCQPCVIAAELRRLHALNAELLEALQRSRAQWIHSVNAAFCLAAIAKAEGKV
jgi:hypothetical protein